MQMRICGLIRVAFFPLVDTTETETLLELVYFMPLGTHVLMNTGRFHSHLGYL